MRHTPFFEPLPEPEEFFDEEEQVVDLPWMPPSHIVGVIAPLAVDVFRSDDVAVRVTHAACFRRGFELHVSAWVRPGSQPRRSDHQHHWGFEEPRVGIRLADGTRLGHRHPHAPMDPDSEPAAEAAEAAEAQQHPVSMTQTHGGSESHRASSAWWLHPVPDGDSLEVVVEWVNAGVPESSARVDLVPLREAAEGESVLWDPPPPPEEGVGWFAYAPMGGSVYRSHLTVSMDPEEEGGGAAPDAD